MYLSSWEEGREQPLCNRIHQRARLCNTSGAGFLGRRQLGQLEPLPSILLVPLPRAQEDFPFISFQARRAGDSPVCWVKPPRNHFLCWLGEGQQLEDISGVPGWEVQAPCPVTVLRGPEDHRGWRRKEWRPSLLLPPWNQPGGDRAGRGKDAGKGSSPPWPHPAVWRDSGDTRPQPSFPTLRHRALSPPTIRTRRAKRALPEV